MNLTLANFELLYCRNRRHHIQTGARLPQPPVTDLYIRRNENEWN